MPGRFGRSWELMKLSIKFIRDDKKVLLFPLISGILIAVILFSYIGAIFFTGIFGFGGITTVLILGFIIMYFLFYFIGIYFNTALIGYIMIKLKGGSPNLEDGFKVARENFSAILKWSLVAATVGIILRAIEERVGLIGKIIISIIGFAWAMATFFIIPVLIYEKRPVWESVKRSGKLFKDTWGETLISHFGLGIIFFLISLLVIIPLVMLMFFLLFTFGLAGLVVGVALLFIFVVLIALVASAAQGVIVAALYRYATTGKITPDVVPKHLIR